MPLVDIQVLAGVFDNPTKARKFEEVTNTMVAIEGEELRSVTWVRVQEAAEAALANGGI